MSVQDGNHESIVDESAQVHPHATLLGEVIIKEDVQVWPGAVLKGPMVVGRDVVILDDVHLTRSEIGPGCILGQRVVVIDSILGEECLVGPDAQVLEGSRLGNGCVMEASVMVRGLMFDPNSIIGGAPPVSKAHVSEPEMELLTQKREEFKRKYASYGALHMLESSPED
jgi:carbonic anhydrase/acetyltransferase-like protein (isoleucine patch superfamily)